MTNSTHTTRDKRTYRTMRRLLIIVGVIVVLGMMLIGGAYIYSASLLNTVSATPITASLNSFDGNKLLTLSDADMVGTAYANGVLMQVPNDRDTLSIIDLPIDFEQSDINEIYVSNSVTSWPQVLAISPDGERAYIVETAAEIDDNRTVYENIQTNPPAGRILTVVDLESDQTQTYDVVDNPIHVSIHPEELFVAIGSKEPNKQLALLPITTLDDPDTYQYFPIFDRSGNPAQEITSVSWHPSGEYLAVGINRRELAFFEVTMTNEYQIDLQQIGEQLVLGNTISYGQFTVDGNHYLTTEINWGALPGQLGYVFNPRGEIIAVRFDDTGNHRVTSRVEVGQSPEGFAVSPHGNLIVTVDMRRTYLPDELTFIPGTDLNSLTLLTFDNTTGELTWIDDYGFEGVLPEHVAFDADGDALAVTIYNERENPMNPGYIEFWNVNQTNEMPQLERTGMRISVVRGSHAIATVP